MSEGPEKIQDINEVRRQRALKRLDDAVAGARRLMENDNGLDMLQGIHIGLSIQGRDRDTRDLESFRSALDTLMHLLPKADEIYEKVERMKPERSAGATNTLLAEVNEYSSALENARSIILLSINEKT